MYKNLMLCAVLLFAIGACKTEVDDKQQADVGKTTELKLDTDGMTVAELKSTENKLEWVGAKVTGSHTGGFDKWDGKLYFKDGKLAAARIDIDLTSITSDTPKLTNHLKSADFFDVEKYPRGVFIADKIEAAASGKNTHTVSGQLQLRGVTREISFPAVIKVNGKEHTAESEFAIKRFQFGINYKGAADNLIKDDVVIRFKVKATVP